MENMDRMTDQCFSIIFADEIWSKYSKVRVQVNYLSKCTLWLSNLVEQKQTMVNNMTLCFSFFLGNFWASQDVHVTFKVYTLSQDRDHPDYRVSMYPY